MRRIDAAAKTGFLAALRAGASTAAAAAAAPAGFSAEAFYGARKRDALFRLAWTWAVALSTEDERQRRRNSSLVALVDGVEIVPNNRRVLQQRVVRATRFNAARRQVFLDVFAATADFGAACEAAGVCQSTVYKALAREPDFARRRDEARTLAVARLEDEAVCRRLAAQEALRDPAAPARAVAADTRELMTMLGHHQRREARGGAFGPGPGALARWSFDETLVEIARIMRGYGLRRGISPPGADEAAPPADDGR
ncbi:MAG TPA: hypothetical protein VMG08_08700 [Allosphingosinicella sp.]|nr:hypothetical protein [Allosphingosinicella sp.]